jgi:hypothetical protein
MPWLDDVVTRTTIRSVWGNTVRDRGHHIFDTPSEANAHVANLPDGATCYVTSTGLEYVRRAGVWRLRLPTLIKGVVTGWRLNYSAPMQTGVLTVPAGYATAAVDYLVLMANPSAPNQRIEIKMFSSAGGTQRLATVVFVEGNVGDTFTAMATFPVNAAGDEIRVTLMNMGGIGDYTDCYTDDNNHQLRALLFP